MKIIEDVGQMGALSEQWALQGRRPVLVPTMGFLHDGHRALLRRAKELCAGERPLVLSVFVNTTQFGPAEDFSAYPRDIEKDLEVAGAEGVDVVFCPTAEQMYPGGFQTTVEVPELSEPLCGKTRPGHFAGVATVVLKLFNIVGPSMAVFGMKDYQQLLVIRRMAADLNLGVEIVAVATVRASDGLALSSRNSYLTPEERRAALCVPRSLDAAGAAVASGERQCAVIVEKMKKIIENEPLAVIEYADIRDSETLAPVTGVSGRVVAAVAVRIGRTRLIDNRLLAP